jgi:hypothetical protein
LVEVKTLDRSIDNSSPYEATRALGEQTGFIQIDTIDLLPGWNPGNPAAICVATIPTRLQPKTPLVGVGFCGATWNP